MMDASHFDASEAYAAVDRHRLEDYEPYIYRTRDGGRSWQAITRGLPPGVHLQTVKEDPKRRGLLFAGTELGVFVSFDDGDNWRSLQLNLPAASVRDVVVHDNDLIVATHGRGIWVIDDISVLRQLADAVVSADAFLFAPADGYDAPEPTADGTPLPKDEPFGENPPFGVPIDYYLKRAAAGPVTIEILDHGNQLVRRYSSDERPSPVNPDTLNIPAHWVAAPQAPSAEAGTYRWIWDQRYAPGPALRGRGAGGDERLVPGPPAGPGVYTVRLSVNGRSYSQRLTIKQDPRQK